MGHAKWFTGYHEQGLARSGIKERTKRKIAKQLTARP
jgi:hypothetical protein